MGANTFDLLLQFTGRASGGDGSAPWLSLTRAMGEKSILDARDAGFHVLRVAAAGYGPSWPDDPQHDDLALWRANPAAYWARVDALFDALDQAGMRLVPSFLWNPQQFPALAHATVTDLLRDPASAAAAMATRYITEFVTRYRTRPTILFYEMGNELNLVADLDSIVRCQREHPGQSFWCAATGNFSTDDMISFSGRFVALLHRLDPSRGVSSGFGDPRPGAAHLAARPEWSPGGPDWTPDSLVDFISLLRRTNAPFDVVSLHLYPGPDTVRPALGTKSPADFARLVARVVHPIGKRLFVGEFADPDATGLDGAIADLLRDGTIDAAALWVWEFYQFSPIRSLEGDPYDVEPGHDEMAFAALRPALAPAPGPAAPRVVLTAPLSCARLDGPTTLQAVASVGAAAPARVDFLLDGALLGYATTFPFRLPFDPRAHIPAVVHITARVTAPGGAQATSDATVGVNQIAEACHP